MTDDPILSRAETLERDVWQLECGFMDLLNEDSAIAGAFLQWAVVQWEAAIKQESGTPKRSA